MLMFGAWRPLDQSHFLNRKQLPHPFLTNFSLQTRSTGETSSIKQSLLYQQTCLADSVKTWLFSISSDRISLCSATEPLRPSVGHASNFHRCSKNDEKWEHCHVFMTFEGKEGFSLSCLLQDKCSCSWFSYNISKEEWIMPQSPPNDFVGNWILFLACAIFTTGIGSHQHLWEFCIFSKTMRPNKISYNNNMKSFFSFLITKQDVLALIIDDRLIFLLNVIQCLWKCFFIIHLAECVRAL